MQRTANIIKTAKSGSRKRFDRKRTEWAKQQDVTRYEARLTKYSEQY